MPWARRERAGQVKDTPLIGEPVTARSRMLPARLKARGARKRSDTPEDCELVTPAETHDTVGRELWERRHRC